MKNRINNALKALKLNRGSSIVTVIVAMLFISILGSTLLFATYTGLLVKVSEREGKENFYSAEESMEIIRSGFQQMANDTLKKSYDEAYTYFTYYNSVVTGGEGDDFAEVFANIFKHNLLLYDFDGSATTGTLFDYTSSIDPSAFNFPSTVNINMDGVLGYYNLVVYDQEYEDGVQPPNLSITQIANSKVLIEDNKIIIEGISVVETNPQTRITTTIVSDIVVNVPDFAYSFTPYTVSSVPDFAFVASGTVQTTGTLESNLIGSAYMGEYYGNSGVFTASSGTVINAGNVTLENTARLDIEQDTTLWTTDISVDNARFNLDGSAYVYDDLILERDADVEITGEYIGYNSSSSNPEQSSAILVNGIDTRLDLANVKALTLAGRGFVGTLLNTGTQTSESLAIRSNQRIYLVPTKMLVNEDEPTVLNSELSNPYVFNASFNSLPNVSLDLSYKIWPSFNPFNYGLTANSVKSSIYPLNGGNSAGYYFFEFPNEENADKFFKDYFSNNPELIEFYIDQYLDYLSLDENSTSADGYTFERDQDGDINMFDANISTNVLNYSGTYSNLKQTLTSNISAANKTPYEYLVDVEAIENHVSTNGVYEFTDTTGKVVAVLVYGITENTSSLMIDYPDLAFILGNKVLQINVNSDFSGLLVTDGNVIINGGVEITASGAEVRSALLATNATLGVSIGDFVTFKSDVSSLGPVDNDSWDLNELVEYENWIKR